MSDSRVKICGLTRQQDAQLALSLGASYLGFIFYPKSPRGIDLDHYNTLNGSLTDSFRVAVDVKPDLEKVKRFDEAGFDFFQVHFSDLHDADYLRELSDLVGFERLWLAPKLPPGTLFPESLFQYANTMFVDTFHKDGYGGSGMTGDWKGFRQLKEDYPEKAWILAGGLNPDNIKTARAEADPDILDLSSGVEASPGIKNAEKLRALFEALNS